MRTQDKAVILCHSTLRLCLQCWDPVWELAGVMAAPVPMQWPEKVVEDSQSIWVPATHKADPDETPGSCLCPGAAFISAAFII